MRLLNRAQRIFDEHWNPSYSQEGEDILLGRIFGEKVKGFFVDIGAHHPRRFSNTFLFYERGWRGLNIEPSPTGIAALNRWRPRDINVPVGIGPATNELEYYIFNDAALNTFDKQLMQQREALTGYRVIAKMKVRVERLDAVLRRHLPHNQQIDFMSVDTEGFDLSVLQSNDWSEFRPTVVLAEALDFVLEAAGTHPVHQFMQNAGYELMAKTVNTLFYRDAQ
jgi:FkbM family methyltransferase